MSVFSGSVQPGRGVFWIAEMGNGTHCQVVLRLKQAELLDLLHPLNHRDAEGASLLTVPAGDTVLRPGTEGLVVGPDRLRNLGLHHRQVVEFVDHGDVDALGAGGAVTAVGALAGIGVAGCIGQNAGVIPLLLRGRLIVSH